MLKILCSKKSLPSGKLLAMAIYDLIGKYFPITTNPEKCKDGCIIRYGNPLGRFSTQYNTCDFIRLTSSKNTFSKKLQEVGLYTPSFYTSTINISFPACIRETLHGFRGQGIHIAETQEIFNALWKNGFYWTPFINLDFELRVHVLGGKMLKVFKKVWEKEDEEPQFPIRTSAEYNFSLRSFENYPRLLALENPLNILLGENCFYALDVGWYRREGKYFILEANSAPGLNSETAKLYAEFLINRLELT
jgi:hypothetical protein